MNGLIMWQLCNLFSEMCNANQFKQNQFCALKKSENNWIDKILKNYRYERT